MLVKILTGVYKGMTATIVNESPKSDYALLAINTGKTHPTYRTMRASWFIRI